MRRVIFVLFLLAASGLSGAVEWKNLDADRHLGGRKASAGYLQGKVVLVCRWNPSEAASKEMLMRMEEIWQGFKTKPFVLLGGSCEGHGTVDAARESVAACATTFPAYAGAALNDHEPRFTKVPFLYVVDETGKVVYFGKEDRNATQAIVMALTDLESPRDLKQWERFLDYEIANLPGRATLRLKEFKKKFPAEAKAYAAKEKELASILDVRRLSELVEFARKAKDMRTFDTKSAVKKQKFATMIKSAISKYTSLVKAKDPRVVQEAKNALADLKWTLAAL